MLDAVFLVGTFVQQDPTSLPSGYGLGPQVFRGFWPDTRPKGSMYPNSIYFGPKVPI